MAYEKAQLNFSNLKRVKIEQIVVGLLSVRFGFRCFQHLFFFRSREFPRVVGFFYCRFCVCSVLGWFPVFFKDDASLAN